MFTKEEWMDKSGDWFVPITETGCWVWTRCCSSGRTSRTIGGYGRLRKNRRDWLAHRVSYEVLRGPIPEGMTIDHLCRVRCCVNPDHLEIATVRDNVLRGDGWMAKNARKTHCLRGHELTPDNVYPCPKGRHCKACWSERRKMRPSQ